MKKLAYICAPYRAETISGIEMNISRAIMAARWVYNKYGHVPIMPHINSRDVLGLIADDSQVVEFDMSLLARCDLMYTFGDRISKGMWAEVKFCEDHNIPVTAVPWSSVTLSEQTSNTL